MYLYPLIPRKITPKIMHLPRPSIPPTPPLFAFLLINYTKQKNRAKITEISY